MDLRKIKKLIDLLEESNLAEIEIKEGEESVRLARTPKGGHAGAGHMAPPMHAQPMHAMPMQSPVDAATGGSARPAAAHEGEGDGGQKLPDGHVVRAPMVGTFYSSPAPDKPAFVTVGQSVKAGETLGIIEAMKMFNEITAGVSGKIVECLVANEEPVDNNKPLFKVLKS